MTFEELFPNIGIETKEIEFKGVCNEGKDQKTGELKQTKWIKTIVAFSNCEGGDLYIGVEDKTHTVIALDRKTADEQMNLIRREGKQRVEPPLSLDPIAIPVSFGKETRYIIKLHVEKAKNIPVMLKAHNAYCVYVRKFGASEVATPEEIRELVLNSEETSFDLLPSDETYNQKDFTFIKKEYEANHNNEILLDKTLQLRGFFSKDGKLAQGALLFKDDYDGDKTTINIAKWPGFDRGSASLIYLKKINGPITKSIHEAVDIVTSISTNGIKKTNYGEERFFAYPVRSVLEGIANAFAHRNYWKIGTQIQIDLFLDRMEITSPGSLVSGRELHLEKNISGIIPQHRNALIANILSLLGIIQGLGTGFDKIQSDYKIADDNHQPFVNSDSTSFTLVLPDLSYEKGVIGDTNPFPDVYLERGNLPEKEMKILSYCYNEKRSISEIAQALGIQVSSYLRNQVVATLVKTGHLIQVSEKPMKFLTNRLYVKLKP